MKRMRKVFRSEEGFTLIELLIVIAVLGILAGIAVPRITGVRTDAANSAAQATASTIRNAMEMYYAKEGNYPVLAANDNYAAITSAFSGSGISLSVDSANYTINVTTDGGVATGETSYEISVKHNDGTTTYYVTESGVSTTTS